MLKKKKKDKNIQDERVIANKDTECAHAILGVGNDRKYAADIMSGLSILPTNGPILSNQISNGFDPVPLVFIGEKEEEYVNPYVFINNNVNFMIDTDNVFFESSEDILEMCKEINEKEGTYYKRQVRNIVADRIVQRSHYLSQYYLSRSIDLANKLTVNLITNIRERNFLFRDGFGSVYLDIKHMNDIIVNALNTFKNFNQTSSMKQPGSNMGVTADELWNNATVAEKEDKFEAHVSEFINLITDLSITSLSTIETTDIIVMNMYNYISEIVSERLSTLQPEGLEDVPLDQMYNSAMESIIQPFLIFRHNCATAISILRSEVSFYFNELSYLNNGLMAKFPVHDK